MPTSTLLLALTTSLLTSASPISQPSNAALEPRRILAGGPSQKPIPSNCTITNPLTTLASSNTTTYMISNSTLTSSRVYDWYLPMDSVSNSTGTWQQCLEQCYGYGTEGTCKSAFMADNAPTPAGYYGSAGGELERGCLMFGKALTAEDFVEAPQGEYTGAVAGDISCPA